MIPALREISYEESLKECGLTTLKTRRLRGNQIEVAKILNVYDNIDRIIFFSLMKDSRTKGHEVSIGYQKVLIKRTINEWDRLSADCVSAIFKKTKLTNISGGRVTHK